MINTKTYTKEKSRVNKIVTKPDLEVSHTLPKELHNGVNDISKIANDVIFISFAVVAMYVFYNVLLSFMM